MSSVEILAALQVLFVGFLQSAAAVWPAFVLLFSAAFLDLLSGASAAILSHTFDAKFLPAWIDAHAEKVVKISLGLIAAVVVGGTSTAAGLGLIAVSATAAGLYLAAVVSSISGNIGDAKDGTKGAPSSGGTVGTTILSVSTTDPVPEG